jgi:hypothetical protein
MCALRHATAPGGITGNPGAIDASTHHEKIGV